MAWSYKDAEEAEWIGTLKFDKTNQINILTNTTSTNSFILNNSAGVKIVSAGSTSGNGGEINVYASNGTRNFNINGGAAGSTLIGNTNAASNSIILQLMATTAGFLVPQMTDTQMRAISSANIPFGLMVYNISSGSIYVRSSGAVWVPITTGAQ